MTIFVIKKFILKTYVIKRRTYDFTIERAPIARGTYIPYFLRYSYIDEVPLGTHDL